MDIWYWHMKFTQSKLERIVGQSYQYKKQLLLFSCYVIIVPLIITIINIINMN